ncbi:hypothetical protein ACFXPZ_31345 [Streptomyces sp. NPDC059101]|uniref:hypothetical protein n=1 Tax=unclassified Streptomyces TaxID=2593676 RepID=UPI0036A9E0B9
MRPFLPRRAGARVPPDRLAEALGPWRAPPGPAPTAPRLAAAQDATGPDRADAAFELTLAGYLAHLRELRAGATAPGAR